MMFNIFLNTESFAVHEFDAALTSTKNNEQPGPDGVFMELFKWMDSANRLWFLQLIKWWWESKIAPEDLFLAQVVTIYKKGDTDDP